MKIRQAKKILNNPIWIYRDKTWQDALMRNFRYIIQDNKTLVNILAQPLRVGYLQNLNFLTFRKI